MQSEKAEPQQTSGEHLGFCCRVSLSRARFRGQHSPTYGAVSSVIRVMCVWAGYTFCLEAGRRCEVETASRGSGVLSVAVCVGSAPHASETHVERLSNCSPPPVANTVLQRGKQPGRRKALRLSRRADRTCLGEEVDHSREVSRFEEGTE